MLESLAHIAALQKMTGKGENWLIGNLIKAGLDQLMDGLDENKRIDFETKVNAELETAGEDTVPSGS